MESAFAASSFGASGSRIGTTRTPVSRYGGRGSGDKTEETGGSIYEQLYASGVRSMGDAYFVGGSAAANQAKNVLERGGSNAQALWSGLAAGAAETFFEKFSVDQLLKPKTINNWKSLLTETAKQAGVEASEEMFTEVANILSDAAIMGDSSDFSTAVAGYIAQGMSEEKAKQMAFLDCISRVVWAGAGGALSGGLMGGTVGTTRAANWGAGARPIHKRPWRPRTGRTCRAGLWIPLRPSRRKKPPPRGRRKAQRSTQIRRGIRRRNRRSSTNTRMRSMPRWSHL